MKFFGILLIVAALIAGMAGCIELPPQEFEIRTWYDLDKVRHNMEAIYRLMNDLDATTAGYEELASPTANGGKGWNPIGYWDPGIGGRPFRGTFDGRGYEIRDLFINRPDQDCVGLFAVVGGFKKDWEAIVVNVGVVNATVIGGSYVGALVGYNTEVLDRPATVSNSYSAGSVAGREYVGGLVGYNDGAIISNSYSASNVTGDESVGGLVGYNVGYNNFYGAISNSYSASNVTGDEGVGGLLGCNDGTVSDCYATGSVRGGVRVGGLVGENVHTVSRSYSTGSVSGDRRVGGLVGWNEGMVSHSFWDTETSGQIGSPGGRGKTTAEMKDITTFSGAGWNIIAVANPGARNPSYIWNIVNGVTYPFLSWQPVS